MSVLLGIRGAGPGLYKEVTWEPLAEGDAEELADLMVAALPPDIGPAVLGSDPDLGR